MKIVIEFDKENLDIIKEYMFDWKECQGLISGYKIVEVE